MRRLRPTWTGLLYMLEGAPSSRPQHVSMENATDQPSTGRQRRRAWTPRVVTPSARAWGAAPGGTGRTPSRGSPGDDAEQRFRVPRLTEHDRRVALTLRQREVAFRDGPADGRAVGEHELHLALGHEPDGLPHRRGEE